MRKNKIFDSISQKLGVVGVAMSASALFMVFGSIISLSVLLIGNYALFFYQLSSFTNFAILFSIVIIATTFISVSFYIFFKMSQFFANLNYLPHIFSFAPNVIQKLERTGPIFIAILCELLLLHFDVAAFLYTIIFHAILFFTLYVLSKSIKLYGFCFNQRARVKQVITLIKTVILFLLTVILFLGCCFVFVHIFKTSAIASVVTYILSCVFMTVMYYYYANFRNKLSVDYDEIYLARPQSLSAYVLVSKINKLSVRAISYAYARHGGDLTILSVDSKESTILDEWKRAKINIPIRMIKYQNNITESLDLFLRKINKEPTKNLMVVYIPHLVTKHNWESFFHNNMSENIIRKLERIPGIVIASVPWQD